MQKAIKEIMDKVTDECVITSCGFISREVYHIKDRARNFYVQGAMSMALAIGLGLAYQRPDIKVIVIQGDGATLMSMGTLVLYSHLSLPNIDIKILNNNSYASTGGQPTCFETIRQLWDGDINIIDCGKESDAPRIPMKCKAIKERFYESIRIRD